MGASLTSALALCLDDVAAWNMYAGTGSLITIIAATNEPWAVDIGFLRPGRFDKRVFVGPLDLQGRYLLLREALNMYELVRDNLNRNQEQMLMDLCEKLGPFCTGADITLFAQNVKMAHFRDNENEIESVIRLNDNQCEGSSNVLFSMDAQYLLNEIESFLPSANERDINQYVRWGSSCLL